MITQHNSTRIQAEANILQKRQLPDGLEGDVLVRIGQELSAVQVVARAELIGGYQIIDAAQHLDIKPNDLAQYLDTEIGTAVRTGQSLVTYKKRFGRSRSIKSPVEGMLEDVYQGRLLIRKPSRRAEARAMIPGRVVHILPNKGASIAAVGVCIQGLWSTGYETAGQLKMLVNTPDGRCNRDQIKAEAQGSILAVGHLNNMNAVKLAADYGARGLISGSAAPELFAHLQTIDLPVVLTDGVGPQPMTYPIFELLSQHNGRETSLLAGRSSYADRPTIVIPTTDTDQPNAEDTQPELTPGQRVRILVAPYMSRIGVVKTVYGFPNETELGFRMTGADVTLPDGETVFIPDRNLDIIM